MASSTSEFKFELPLGVLIDGKVVQKMSLRQMTGTDRILMANPKFRKNGGEFVTSLLNNCITSIGGDKPNPRTIGNMVVGDRDFLLLKLRQISLEDGDTIHATMRCGICEEVLQVDFDVNDLNINFIDPKKLDIEDDRFIITLKDKARKINIKMKLPTGKDQEKIAPMMQKNPFKANYMMYERCLYEWNGDKGPFSLSFLRDQPTKILDWLEREFEKAQPGPNWDEKVECDECGGDTRVRLSNSDFLIPLQQ